MSDEYGSPSPSSFNPAPSVGVVVDVKSTADEYGAPPSTDFNSDFSADPSNDYSVPSSGFDAAPADNEYGAPSESFTDNDVVTGYAAPAVQETFEEPADEYGAPTSGDIFTGLESVADYDNVPVYNPIDTNSIESGLGVPEYEYEDEPLTSYIDVNLPSQPASDSYGSPGENTQGSVPVAADTVYDILDAGYDDSAPQYDSYDDYEEELPSYLVPSGGDAYQAAPSISVEYASPRDTSADQSLVIDLTDASYEDYEETPVYGQRIGPSSRSYSNILLSRQRRV